MMTNCHCPSWIRIEDGPKRPDTPEMHAFAQQATRAGLKVEMYHEEGPMYLDFRHGLICGTCNPEYRPANLT